MELEEMKTRWAEMSAAIEKQKKLTDSIIIKMTQLNYKNKLNNILIPEAAGSFICFANMLYIVMNFQKLNTWYLQLCGIVAAVMLFVMPVLSINAIWKIRSINVSANNYKQSLIEYSKRKMQFVSAQQLSFYLASVLMLVILPVMGQLMDGKDIFKKTDVWYVYAIGFPFFYYFARWVFKSYVKTTVDAENILKELEA